jgi:hypothetical protein
MKLLYLYVEDYAVLKKTEFNFDSERKFHFDLTTRQLAETTEYDKVLPSNFFDAKGVVESVSVIIGDNGAGKTSLARVLNNETFTAGNSSNTTILIWKDKGKFYWYSRSKESVDVSKLINIEKYDGRTFSSSQFSVVYLTAHFGLKINNLGVTVNAMGHDGPINAYHDLSIKTLIWEAVEKFINEMPREKENGFALQCYKHLEIKQNLGFMDNVYNPNFTNGARLGKIIPPIFNIAISINNAEKPLLDNAIKDIKDRNAQGKMLLLSERMDQMLHNSNTFAKRIEMAFLTNYALNHIARSLGIYTETPIKEHLVNLVDEFEEALSAFGDRSKRYRKLNECLDILSREKGDGGLEVEYCGDYLLVNLIDDNGRLRQDQYSAMLRFVDAYFHCVSITDFLNFDFRLSSGEQAWLNIFSRLHGLFQQENQRELLIFLDEIEITQHPERQREIIFNLIEFLNMFYGDVGNGKRHFHLILATHSPLLLSDIPKSNVIVISRRGDNGEIVNTTRVLKEAEVAETFGANIYSLYKRDFAMKGLTGKLAEGKINAVFDMLNSKDDIPSEKIENLDKIISVIGEPLIQSVLRQKLSEKTKNVDLLRQIKLHEAEINRLRQEIGKGAGNV